MIRSFKIKAQKDENGLYILPNDIIYRDEVLTNLKYHEREMGLVKNVMFAIITIICAINRDKLRDTTINGWTKLYVRINDIPLFFSHYYLDKDGDMLYEAENRDELTVLQRQLKIKKLKK
jgi:hypothetical protein